MSRRQCFVISPIGESGSEIRRRADQVLKHVIIPSAVDCGFALEDIARADTISNPGAITHQIISAIINADLVIADLTGNNANVYYELAIRHVLRKPYVQICDTSTSLPFDVKNQRTIIFDYKDLDSVAEAKHLIAQYSLNALENPENLMTPIHEGLVIEGLLKSEKPNDQLLGQLIENVAELTNQVEEINNKYLTAKDPQNEIGLELKPKQPIRRKPAIPLHSPDELKLVVPGVKIDHEKFGVGTVVSMSTGGTFKTAKINFAPPAGTKELVLAFAPYRIIERN